jgi:hypothetical protein
MKYSKRKNKMYLSKVIFSIDNVSSLHTMATFTRFLDTKRAMDKLVGSVTLCVGSYKGELEPSFMMNEVDFNKFIRGTDWIKDQESILNVPGDVRQPCYLEYLDSTDCDVLYPMVEVAWGIAKYIDSWTYVPATGKYFTCDR